MAAPSRLVTLSPAPLPSAPEMRWADKDPADALDYTFDATAFNAANKDGDLIAGGSVAIAFSPPGPTAALLINDGNLLAWMISGGLATVPITDYGCTVSFTTLKGRAIRRTVWLRVEPLSPNRSFPLPLSLVAGLPGLSITEVTVDGAGNLIFYAGAEPLAPVAVTPAIAASSALRQVTTLAPTGELLVLASGDTAVIHLSDFATALAGLPSGALATAANLSAEEGRAQEIESGLQDQIDALQGQSGVTPQQLASAVAVEAQRAESIEGGLGQAIAAEVTARITQATQLQAEIDTLQAGGTVGGGAVLPVSAPLMGSDASRAALAIAVGANLVLQNGVLSAARTGWPINTHLNVQVLLAAGLSQILGTVDVGAGEAASYAANLAGSVFKCEVAPAADYAFYWQKNGATVATITFLAGTFTAAIVSAAFTTAAGDKMQFVGQNTPDTSIAFIHGVAYGTLL